jgi:DNA-binding transcriptional LysR family regulator
MFLISKMNRIHPSTAPLDLNLLWTLGVLLEERSVRSAATRLGVTPSAVSHALARLRDALDDDLLVRSGRVMVPTARGEALAASVRAFTEQVRSVAGASPAFDPRTSTRRFVIATTDNAAFALVPEVMRLIHEQHSRVIVVARALGVEPPFAALERGELDLAIAAFGVQYRGAAGSGKGVPAGFRNQRLWRERLACVLREGHPALERRLTLAAYAKLDHVLVAPRGATRGMVDDRLEALGLERRIALYLAHHLVAPFVVARTDLALTISRNVAETFARSLPIRVVAPPLQIADYDVLQLWHERVQRDPGHAWLRGVLAQAAQELRR